MAVPEAGVVAALRHELGMGAVLHDTSLGQHDDAVEARHGGEALYWSSTTPNLSLEFGLGKRTTLDLTGAYNPWRCV